VLATEFLADLVRRLESLDVTYALVGSIATMSYGEPRATLDIDVVIALGASDLDAMKHLFPPPDFYLSADAARVAVRSKSQFNVIHPASGMKVDFFVAGDDIERSQLERRLRRALLPGSDAWCSPPEELVVKKLLYYQQGASDKHLRDIASMLRISPEQIDLGRLRDLAIGNNVSELLDRVLAAGDLYHRDNS
jgi:hypothetical protein